MTEISGVHALGMEHAETSAVQDGLWFLEKLDPSSAANTVHLVYRVTGNLDLAALRAAWEAVTARHDALRTTLVERDGRPVQEISDEVLPLSIVDLTDAADRNTAVEQWCAGQVRTPLPLSGNEPLARLSVARFGDWEYTIVLVAHRAIADGESMSIVVDELSDAYAAAVDSRAVEMSAPGPRYADFARAQRERAGSADYQRMRDWWVAKLTPPPPDLSMPVDHARPPGPSSAGGAVRFKWGPEICRPLSKIEGIAPSVVLLAGFQALLGRYSGEDQVAVGVPVSTRPQPDFDGVVGQFQNILVHNADLSGGPTFRELLSRVDRLSQDAFAHREVPFDELVRALGPHRDPRSIPLCDAMFVFHEVPEPEPRLPGAVVMREYVDNGSTGADLMLIVHRVGQTVVGSLEYRGCLFEHDSVAALLEQLHTMLVIGLTDPDLSLRELPLDRPMTIRTAVRAADQIGAGPSVERPAHELVGRHDLDAVAVSWGGEDISYRTLNEQAALVASALGDVAGSAVAVRMPSGAHQIATVLGVLRAGGQVVCLGPGDAGERGKAVLADVFPVAMVLDGELEKDKLAQWYARLGGYVLEFGAIRPGAEPDLRMPVALTERAYVTYTSGSTGAPKGIPQTHGTLAQFVSWFGEEFRLGPGSRVAQWAAPGYDAALCEAFAALVSGATLCPVPDRIRANPEKIVDWLAAERITLFQTVPSFAKEILKVINSGGLADRLAALDHILLAGEALPGELANGLRAALPGVRLVNLYGPTESILATWHEITGPLYGTAPIGKSIPGRQVLVLDELDRPCPAGVTGWVVIRSPYATPGYIGASAGDRAAFAPLHGPEGMGIYGTGFYRTGDMGRRRFDGALEFRGRGDFQIKFNGMRVELTDIEAALDAHESVAECAVIAVRDQQGLVNRLVAYVVPVRGPDGKAMGAADVWRTTLRRRFGSGMLPVSFKTMIGLPRNIGGKVDRRGLPDPGPASLSAARPPETPVELAMAAIWSELLGVESIGADDTFFAVGGHSLLVPRLLDRIHEQFQVDISLWDYFANPTLTGLSALVDQQTVLESRNQHTVTG